MPDRTRGDAAEDVGASALEQLAGLAGITVSGVGTATQWITQKVREEWATHRSIALRAAERTFGLSREELAEQVAADPRLVPLVTRLLYSAGMNGQDRTLGAMGAAFGDAVKNRAAVDECELILTSLDGLTDTHATVLTLMTQELPLAGGRPGHWTVALVTERSNLSRSRCPRNASVDRCVEAQPGIAPVAGEPMEPGDLGRTGAFTSVERRR